MNDAQAALDFVKRREGGILESRLQHFLIHRNPDVLQNTPRVSRHLLVGNPSVAILVDDAEQLVGDRHSGGEVDGKFDAICRNRDARGLQVLVEPVSPSIGGEQEQQSAQQATSHLPASFRP